MTEKNGFKKTKLGWIPEDWEVKRLKEVCKINQGLQIAISKRFTEQVKDSFFYITNEFLKVNSNKRYFVKKPTKSVICDKNDILMTRTGNTGQVVTNVEGVFHNNFFKIKYSNEINKDFLVYFLRFPTTQNLILVYAGTSTIPDLNHSDFYRLQIPLPPLPEQKKIAEILSTWDKCIELTEKLIAQKQRLKKSLMQKLLTGKVRFKEFENEEWKEVKLGDLGKIQTGNTPSKRNKTFWNGTFNWVTADDMNEKYITNTIQKLTALGYGQARVVKSDSVLVTCIASIGKNALTKIETGFNQQINSITPNKNYCAEFIYYLIEFNSQKLLAFAGSGALRIINKQTFMMIKFNFPSLPEQEKIASVLSKCDLEIENLEQQLKSQKEQKKGLMQVLLTGKVRVNKLNEKD